MSDTKGDTPGLAEYYDRISDTQFELGLQLSDLLKIGPGDRVLDVGCGTGRLAFHVSGLTGPYGRVTGVDPSPHRVDIANGKLKNFPADNVSFAIGHGERLEGFGDNVFDVLYYCAVFHWIDDKQAALKEAYRVLKPGGKVGITSRNSNHASLRRAMIREMAERYPDLVKYDYGRVSRWAGKDELQALLADAGFTNIRFETRVRPLYFCSAEEYFAFLKASSFGQSSRLPEHIRREAARNIAVALEQRRTPKGIELQANSLFAIAEKPGVTHR